MAPSRSANAAPSILAPAADTSAPLADYFFIAGVESSQVFDDKNAIPSSSVEDTIEEDKPLATNGIRSSSPTSANEARRSRYSWDARKSIGSIINASEFNGTASNRSSATIRPVHIASQGLTDDAFEEALRKFASERETFLEDIHVSAGTVPVPTSKKPRVKQVRITQDENTLSGASSTLKSGIGSVRKRLSTMNSMRRQPSAISRQSSTRTAKRLSGYNSVMPPPAPFKMTEDMHPLKRRYEPVMLDRYPTPSMIDETKRRNAFPDYVPMFAFPNDVSVVSADERPRCSWHGFAMTNQDNSKLYGVCLTIWIPLSQSASDALERQCEEWRRANMSDEERELARSLGERLSFERAKLSRLLAELPGVTSGSIERDVLEDEISAVEEKISLMTDLLRPVRHGAASKIDGLTEGDSGFWIPRSYGILGRDPSLMAFWKEWLKAVTVPMSNGAILRIPPSSPKVGVWQPLERYVVNLCVEALSPITSITQVEVAIRELRLFARKEAINELPGSRNTDLYALFRCLSIPNIIILFEYAMSESRIIFLSSHTSMLQLACAALTSLMYPFKWAGVYIPVLPQRLITVLEAPCPYIVGIERRYDDVELPGDDFCLVDLDEDTIESTGPPISLPRPQRRKLMSLLQAAAPHQNRYGVSTGPPPYAVETFPGDAFSSENPQIFTSEALKSTLASYVSESSSTFGDPTRVPARARTSVFNAFLQARSDGSRGLDRPSTSSTSAGNSHSSGQSPPSPVASPMASNFHGGTVSRNDSGLAIQTTLRDKRSGHLAETLSNRNSSFTFDRMNTVRRPSAPTLGHQYSTSTSTLGHRPAPSIYAPSVYAQSTLAASTIMPQMLMQPVRDDEATKWVEGHCLNKKPKDTRSLCTICEERTEEEVYKCTGCDITVHARCVTGVTLVCPIAFRADQVRAAFVRCFASLLYTYRKALHPASGDRRKAGMIYHFNMEQFLRSVPHGDSEYMQMLRQTQAFNEFIHERESKRGEDPSIKLFDEIILSKRNRGKTSLFSRSQTSFLSDTSDHLWRSAAAPPPSSHVTGDNRTLNGRTPAKLDVTLMREPRSIQGAPRMQPVRTKRKPVASLLGLNSKSADA